jgi:hypothetical protein
VRYLLRFTHLLRFSLLQWTLCGLLLGFAFDAPARADDSKPPLTLAQQIQNLATQLGQLPTNDPNLKSALDALLQAIKNASCDVATALDPCIERLNDTIAKLTDQVKNKAAKLSTGQVTTIDKQITDLALVIATGKQATAGAAAPNPAAAPAEPAAAPAAPAANAPAAAAPDPIATAAATELANILKAELGKSVDLTDSNLVKALSALVPMPTSPPSTQAAVINVLAAYFGDLATIALSVREHPDLKLDSGSLDVTADPDLPVRVCSATRTMRAYCQGKSSCFDTTAASGTSTSSSHVDGNDLCGFDPVPYAQPKSKGLVIFFECLTAVASDPALHSDRPAAYNKGSDPHIAYLRFGETGGIYCSAPAAPKDTSGGNNTTTSAGPATFNVITGGQNTVSVGAAAPSATTGTPANTPAATTNTTMTPTPAPKP